MKEINVSEILRPFNVSKEFEDWSQRWFNRGRLRLDHLQDINWLREIRLRHHVSLHELGHLKIARKLGWRVLEVVTNAKGPALGWVKMLSPKNITLETIHQSALISMGGNASTNSEFGCGSDFNQARNALRVLNFASKTSLLAEARSMVGPTEILEDQAWELNKAA